MKQTNPYKNFNLFSKKVSRTLDGYLLTRKGMAKPLQGKIISLRNYIFYVHCSTLLATLKLWRKTHRTWPISNQITGFSKSSWINGTMLILMQKNCEIHAWNFITCIFHKCFERPPVRRDFRIFAPRKIYIWMTCLMNFLKYSQMA